jgi:hypothetical protein
VGVGVLEGPCAFVTPTGIKGVHVGIYMYFPGKRGLNFVDSCGALLLGVLRVCQNDSTYLSASSLIY